MRSPGNSEARRPSTSSTRRCCPSSTTSARTKSPASGTWCSATTAAIAAWSTRRVVYANFQRSMGPTSMITLLADGAAEAAPSSPHVEELRARERERRLVAAGRAALGARLLDLPAGRRHRVPLSAEGVEPLAVGLALLRVLDERVERVTVVGDLHASVGTLGGPQPGRPRSGRRAGLGGGDQRRPRGRARARAGALAVLVLLEEVERVSVRVDEDPPERRLRHRDDGRLRPRGLTGRRGDQGARERREDRGAPDERAAGTVVGQHGVLLCRVGGSGSRARMRCAQSEWMLAASCSLSSAAR